ncbi:MAG: TlpA family protein disulfide reductase [Melioribacter sp.]|nr:TlpA family protein disulfide reductase [Melioribacter sp.]
MRKNFLMVILVLITIGFKFYESDNSVIEKIDKNKLQKLIKERKGKVLFLNVWATWCAPCREEFPSIVKLSNEFKDVDFVGISVDFPEEVETKIIPFLKSNKSTFTNYVNSLEDDEELINLLNEKWSGAIPATFIFDKKGKLLYFLEGKKSYEEFKKHIEKARKH